MSTLLVLADGATHHDLARALGQPAARIASAAEDLQADRAAPALYFPLLGIALVDPEQAGAGLADAGCVAAAEPERSYRVAAATAEGDSGPGRLDDDADRTWGIAAVGADRSAFTGSGARICVLDTGLDAAHPAFRDRAAPVTIRSFVAGEGPEDGRGHGTHCAGTAAGDRDSGGRRFGCAPAAALYAGKIFSSDPLGYATDRQILAGIEWALTERCQIVSMSFETPVGPGQGYSPVYERVGLRALDLGCLLVAAAGNGSQRQRGRIAPVSSPADSPSVLAVGAVDHRLQVARFSNGTVNTNGGKLDAVAPGVAVRSSLPGGGYGLMSGTSQATPHVAGVLALWHEAIGATGRDLWARAAVHARPLGPARDYGFGLIQAP